MVANQRVMTLAFSCCRPKTHLADSPEQGKEQSTPFSWLGYIKEGEEYRESKGKFEACTVSEQR